MEDKALIEDNVMVSGNSQMIMEHDPDTGALVMNGRIIGEFDGVSMILNVGWFRLAGIGLRVDGDPQTDRKRTVFERPHTDHRLVHGA